MLNLISKFVRDEAGAAGVEYGILVAFIAAGMVIAVAAIGGYIENAFKAVCSALATGGLTAGSTACPS